MRLLLVALLALPVLLTAQYEKGGFYLSGDTDVTFGQQNAIANDIYTEHAANRAGIFLVDRLLVGGDPFAGSLFGRYYQSFGNDKRLSAFVEFNIGQFYNGIDDLKFEPAVGLEYALRPGLLASVKLKHTFNDFRSPHSTSLELGLNTAFGGTYGKGENSTAFRKGNLLLDPNLGNIRFSNSTTGNRSLLYQLHLGGGMFLTDRLLAEGSVSFANLDLENQTSDFTYDQFNIQADLGLRYLLTKQGRFRPYVGGGVSFRYRSLARVENDPMAVTTAIKATAFSPYLRAGFLYQLSDRVVIDVAADYNFSINDRIFGATHSGLGIGIKYTLGGKSSKRRE